ncbi:MAG: TetR/AcrR family transcriptional regulator [Lachnospiraceae bacterium]|nr:TetR/AcrR family transcriptional regulator [Lachnospiraceae bacterium]
MPKIYTDDERADIRTRLKKEANILMQKKGVKKTTVDELVRRAGIPKGTFYLFYPSKEMLLFDCAQDFHEQVDEYLTEGMKSIVCKYKIDVDKKDALSGYVDEITDVIIGAMKIVQNSCLKVLLEPEAMKLILDKLPKDVLEKHRKQDNDSENGMFKELISGRGMDIEEITGAFTMVIFGSMYRQVIGQENMEAATRYLVKGLVIQIFG